MQGKNDKGQGTNNLCPKVIWGEKPGFCDNVGILTEIWLRNPVSAGVADLFDRSWVSCLNPTYIAT